MRCGALGPETHSSNFPFWAVRHPAWSPKGERLLVRSFTFILLGRHCISCLAAPCNPASREGQPRTPASPDPPFLCRSYFCQYLGERTFTVCPGDASAWWKAEKHFHTARPGDTAKLKVGRCIAPCANLGKPSSNLPASAVHDAVGIRVYAKVSLSGLIYAGFQDSRQESG